MKFNSKICALSLALAMGAGMLAGCNSNKGGNTPKPPVKYLVNATDTADYSFAGLHEDKLYTEGESVSFTVSLLNDEKLISQVGYVSGSERNPLELINEAYSFEMPANNVTLFVTLRDVDRYEITYEGKLQVDGDPIVFGLKKNGAAQLTWTLSAVEGGEHVTIDDHTVTPVSQGSVTFAASMQGVEVARKEVTVEKSAYYTIREAIDDAWENTPNFNDNSKETYSTGKYKIRAKVVFIGEPYREKVETIIDDGTGLLDYTIKSSTSITKFAVGDVIEINESLQNYKGLIETYSSDVQYVKVVTDYPITATEFVDVADGEAYDTYYNNNMVNNGEHKIIPMTFKATAKVHSETTSSGTTNKERYEVNGATAGYIATSKSIIDLAWQENAAYNFKGYLVNWNDSAKYCNFVAIEQSKLAAQSVTIDQEDQELSLNNTLQLTYTTNPVGAGVNVSWSSDNTNVATVSDSGLVHAVAAGTATITLTVDGQTDTIVITVPAALKPATAASFDEATANVEIGATLDLDAKLTVTPSDTTDSKVWSVEEGKDDVLTIDQQGVATGVGAGTAVVTAKLNDDVSAQITVTVKAPHGTTIDDPLTAEEAFTIGKKLAGQSGKSVYSTETYYTKGVLTDTPTVSDGKASKDTVINGQLGLYNTQIGTFTAAQLEKGAEIIVHGQICNYSAGYKIQFAGQAQIVSATSTVAQFIEISGDTSVETGKTTTLTATIYPASLGLSATFASSNTNVATVDQNTGVVTGVAVGKATITATYSTLSDEFEISVVEPLSPTATTVTKNSLIGLKGLDKDGAAATISAQTANGTQIPTLYIDSVVTLSVNATGNNGKVYGSGTEWRLYQSNNPSVQLSVTSGYKLVSVKFVYTIANTGVLKFGNDQVESEALVTLSGQSATFTVGNTGSATNGQVKITGIVVVYDVVSQ